MPDELAPTRRIRPPEGWTLVALVVALCFFAGAAGWALAQERSPGPDSVDVGFLRDMRSHHESAVRLAQLELVNGQERSIVVFADEILRFQSYEMGVMDRMQVSWGHRPENRPDEAMAWMGDDAAVPVEEMPGVPTEAELDRLRTAGPETDAVFVALMIDHHAGGVAMAEHAAREAGTEAVRALAARMAAVQEAEIGEMRAAAERAGLDLTPAGVEADVAAGHDAHTD